MEVVIFVSKGLMIFLGLYGLIGVIKTLIEEERK